jgi:DNA-binding transcriptional ArsR family regulator
VRPGVGYLYVGRYGWHGLRCGGQGGFLPSKAVRQAVLVSHIAESDTIDMTTAWEYYMPDMEYVTSDGSLAGQAALHQALAHPVRLQILEVLAHGEACVCHLTAVLGRRQPYVSQQLAALRDAGLVVDRREGTLIYYHVRDARLVALLALGRTLAGADQGGGDRAPALAAGPVPDCPCPKCQGHPRRQNQEAAIRLHA